MEGCSRNWRRGQTGELLPVDLTIDMLSRVPARALLKLRNVSKSWDSITIHDPNFVHLHRRRVPVDSLRLRLVIPIEGSDYTRILFYTLFDNGDDVGGGAWTMKLDSSYSENGLFRGKSYMLTPCRGLLGLYDTDSVAVFNPATQEHVSFPASAAAARATVATGEVATYAIELGFDLSTNKYKVVHLFVRTKNETSCVWGCEICTVGSGTWRPISTSWLKNILVFDKATEVKGVLYWLVWSKVDGFETILTLDLKYEKFGHIPYEFCFTKGPRFRGDSMCLAKLDEEHLFLATYGGDLRDGWLDIWMIEPNQLNNYTVSVWTRIYEIRSPGIDSKLVPKYIWNGKILFYWNGDLFSYDPSKETFKVVVNKPKDFPRNHAVDCNVLVETMGSLLTP